MFKTRFISILVLLMTAVTGAWAQRLYLEVDGTAATLKYSANEADYSGKPSFTGTTWQNASGFKAYVTTITVDASCENFAGDKLQGLFTACSVLTSVTGLGTINTTNVTTMQQMFNNCSKLETVDLSGFNTANVTTMQQMFNNCSKLETVDLSGFNTANVTDMKNMFYNCSSLETVDLSSFNTSSVTNMSYMFMACTGLKSVNFSGLNTSSVTNMSYMFNGCSKLETVDLSGFNTANVTDMKNMFQGCTGLKSVNFSGLNTSGVTTMTYMFQGCTGLQTLDLSDLNTSSVTDMRNMFHNCTGLQTLDISSFNTGNVTKMGSMFNGCSQLTAIFVGDDWSVASSANSMFTDCTNLPNWDGTSDGTKAYYGGDGKGYLTYKVDGPTAATYTVTLKEGTEDATNWTITPAEATTTGVAAGTEVKATYGGTKKVKSVKAVKKVAAAPATGHALSASQVGEIVCSDGLAYAAADKDNLPTGVTAVAIVAYLGDGDTSDNTYNNGLAIAMTNANDGSGCGWGDWGATYHCVSESNDIATAIGYKDGISSTNTLTSDGHYHEAATAAASNNGTAAPTGTSGWFLPSIGQWNLIVQGLASKKAGSAVTTDITKFDENDTYKASNLNSVITDAGGTGFNGGYQSSTQYDGEECWHMDISSGRAWSYGFSAGDYVRSVLAF